MPHTERVGLVVAGAGARGAYEAGALTELVPRMADDGAPPGVLVGTSAGALNVVALAAFAHEGWAEATRRLVAQWTSIHLRQVADVLPSLVQDASRYAGQLAGLPIRIPSLFDTRVQRKTLSPLLHLDLVHRNVDSGIVDAVALATTSARTGGTVVFLECGDSVPVPEYDAARNIRYVRTRLTVDHVLASAAVPVAFRPVRIDGEAPAADDGDWYLDGGVRLNVPLKPALRLGCDRLGVVATHPASWPAPAPDAADSPDVYGAAALALKALLVDRMVEDLHTLTKINDLVPSGTSGTTVAEASPTDVREVPFLFAGPPPGEAGALGEAALHALQEYCADPAAALHHPDVWTLNRLVGGTRPDHGDLLSFLLFEPRFTERAAELGARHARELLATVAPGKDNWPTVL